MAKERCSRSGEAQGTGSRGPPGVTRGWKGAGEGGDKSKSWDCGFRCWVDSETGNAVLGESGGKPLELRFGHVESKVPLSHTSG